MTVELKPLDDRVIVELAKREEATAAGVYLPEVARVKPQEGLVIAVGPGRLLESGERMPIEAKAGDKVVFASYAGTEVKLGDRKLLILKENDILAIMVEKRPRPVERRIRMVVENTKPGTGRFPTFTPEALRKAARTKCMLPLLLSFDSEKRLGIVTSLTYDEEREELVAEALLYTSAEIPEGVLPAAGYIWDPGTKEAQFTSIGLSLEPAKSGTRFMETEDVESMEK